MSFLLLERKKISRTETFVVLQFYTLSAKIQVRKSFQNCSSVKVNVHKTLKNQRKSSWLSFLIFFFFRTNNIQKKLIKRKLKQRKIGTYLFFVHVLKTHQTRSLVVMVSGNMEKTDNVICQATKSALNSNINQTNKVTLKITFDLIT